MSTTISYSPTSVIEPFDETDVASASERRLRALVENAWDGVAITDPQGKVMFATPALGRLLGYSEDIAAALNAFELVHPDDLAGMAQFYDEVNGKPGTRMYREQRMRHADGTYRWFEGCVVNLEHDPNIRGFVVNFRDITERKQAEALLLESRLRLLQAVESANVGLWDWDLETNRVNFSKIWKAQIGYGEDEIGDDFDEWRSRVHPDDVERAEGLVREFVENPRPNYENEFRFRHKDGTHRWILARASVISDDLGRPVRMLGAHLDITERKQMLETLQRNHDLLEAAEERAQLGSWEFDWVTGIGVWSRQMYRLFHRAPDLGPPSPSEFIESVHPDDRHLVASAQAVVPEPGKPSTLLIRTNPALGPVRRLSCVVYAICDDTGRTTRMAGTILDVTEHVQTEATIKEHERLLQLLIDHSPVALAMFDRNMVYLAASRRWMADYTLDVQEVIGRCHYDIFPDLPERWKEAHRRCLAGESAREAEDCFVTPDGRTMWLSWEVQPWLDREGNVGGIVIFTEDITDRKRASDEIRERNEALQHLSQRLVESQESERSQVARELHDEIGQALSTIKINLLVLQTSIQSDQQVQRISDTVEVTDHTLELVRDMTLKLRPAMLDDLGLVPAIRWHADRFSTRTGIRTTLKLDTMESQSIPSAIQTTCFRVIQEALTNVMRHADAKHVRIELAQEKSALHLLVADNGRGFSVVEAKRRAVRGKSMGIMAMEERCRLVGGQLHLFSRKNSGTTVRAEFPLE